ncbi:IS1 family transposase [Budviciaceae bacterium CWB-B4]|uniref:IS1 family transposase n=1 Tax=Limnobaculum xujianqingii TaxID=2738837 RepID=A0A9D7AFH9_9GAMM|nr:IS1 family transposase [Limnobaculum xujianqingii]MBK5071778.1 IS1 family transposase [Limnobaculum xujianqingii]MBK5175087.1 IS1 family transposase [Limnobaculum xujianqingii]
MFKRRIYCRYCSRSNAIKKHGTAPSGYQRYLCGHCQKTFQENYIYQAYKTPDEVGVKETQRGLSNEFITQEISAN